MYIKNTVHNFSSYQLTTKEYTALSYGFYHHIPFKFNSNRIHTELEQFYQSILKDIIHILESNLSSLKTSIETLPKNIAKYAIPTITTK